MTNRWSKSILVFLGLLGATYVEAQAPRTLEVYGEGQIEVVPDMAYVQVGVTTVGQHVEKASAENARAVEAVLSAVGATGVERTDMTTSNFSIGMERNYREEKDRAVYRVNNMVDITVHDLSIIGQVLWRGYERRGQRSARVASGSGPEARGHGPSACAGSRGCTAKSGTSGVFARSRNRPRVEHNRGGRRRAGSPP